MAENDPRARGSCAKPKGCLMKSTEAERNCSGVSSHCSPVPILPPISPPYSPLYAIKADPEELSSRLQEPINSPLATADLSSPSLPFAAVDSAVLPSPAIAISKVMQQQGPIFTTDISCHLMPSIFTPSLKPHAGFQPKDGANPILATAGPHYHCRYLVASTVYEFSFFANNKSSACIGSYRPILDQRRSRDVSIKFCAITCNTM